MCFDIDTDFYELVYDEHGRAHPVLRRQITKAGGGGSEYFPNFDTSHGHCGLCGSLSCNGNCFK